MLFFTNPEGAQTRSYQHPRFPSSEAHAGARRTAEATGYTLGELARIEHACALAIDRRQPNSPQSVYTVLRVALDTVRKIHHEDRVGGVNPSPPAARERPLIER